MDSDPFSQLAELVEELQLPLANLCEGSWAATSAQVNEVVEAKIEAAFEKIAERIRQQLQRPRENEIPRLLGRGMHAVFENVWPDLREMLLEYAMSGVERGLTRVRKDLPLKPPPSQPPSRLARVRNRLLYTLYPYDRSFLSQCCQARRTARDAAPADYCTHTCDASPENAVAVLAPLRHTVRRLFRHLVPLLPRRRRQR